MTYYGNENKVQAMLIRYCIIPVVSWTCCVASVTLSQLVAAEPKPLRVLEGHSNSVVAIAFSRDGKSLASGANDGFIRIWDVGTGNRIAACDAKDGVDCLAFLPTAERTIVFAGFCSPLSLWHEGEKEGVTRLGGKNDGALAVAVSPDGRTLAVGATVLHTTSATVTPGLVGSTFTMDFDSDVELWDTIKRAKITTLAVAPPGQISSLAFSPDGATLASATNGDRNNVNLWDVASGRRLATLCGHVEGTTSISFSPDGKILATCSAFDMKTRLWDVATGRNTATLQSHSGPVFSVAFSPDGKMLASGNWDKVVNLWDVSTGNRIGSFKAHSGSVLRVAFSPDGKMLASSSADDTVKLWDVASLLDTHTEARGESGKTETKEREERARGKEDGSN